MDWKRLLGRTVEKALGVAENAVGEAMGDKDAKVSQTDIDSLGKDVGKLWSKLTGQSPHPNLDATLKETGVSGVADAAKKVVNEVAQSETAQEAGKLWKDLREKVVETVGADNVRNAGNFVQDAREQVLDAAEKIASNAKANNSNVVQETLKAGQEVLQSSAKNNPLGAGIAGATGTAFGVAMTYDGFMRLRKGLGFSDEKDGASLSGTVAGALETGAGVGAAILGAYTALVAFRGKGGPASRI